MQITKQIIETLKKHPTIIIHRHERPDPDAIGSQAGLAAILTASFPDKKILITGYNEESLTFLKAMDTVDDASYELAAVVVCDTANQPRIDDKRFSEGQILVKIDHHPIVDDYGHVSWVDTKASSTSEMIYRLAKEESLTITDEAARLLYAGIVGDTGRFLYPSTTDQTFAVAAALAKHHFDRTALYNQMYEVDPKIARLKGYLLDQINISSEGSTNVRLTKDVLAAYDITSEQTSALVGAYGDIKGIRCWAIFVEEDDKIRVRLRSKGPVINQLAAKYRGGGHPLASGATVMSWEEADQLIKDLDDICRAHNNENKKG
ncbi:phosphoesterase RecJ-like protein [Streptohalobacillus salinus]|uniref:Phosphoesterase RecJ-like protein n=1 Tax=Streptohalobacillus salinus TaxID=621096 RepID=A0A2V3W2M5_9BACI|nr:phosphoesterase RecJ-like protein [Streptohalobacillus salinus]